MTNPSKDSFPARLRAFGGSVFHPAMAYLAAVWVTHALLRIFVIFRKDAYGFPFVGKPEWYIFHAFCIDALWIAGYSSPFLAAALILGALRGKRATGAPAGRAGQGCLLALAVFHSVLLWVTVFDQETMRFLGMHLDLSLMGTYGNPASLREVLKFIASDESVRYLPYVLFLACVPFSLLLYSGLRRFAWVRKPRLGFGAPAALGAAVLVSYVFLNFIWTGGFRMAKLRPFTATLMNGLKTKHGEPPHRIPLTRLGGIFQRQWLLEQGDSAYVFPDTSYPYYKEPLEVWCASANAAPGAPGGIQSDPGGIQSDPGAKFSDPALHARCRIDGDRDGFLPGADCDDGDATAHPGARDVPGNGVDEDCDGMDAHPKNFVMILMESHRGVNAGYLRPFGALPDYNGPSPTPVMDSLADGNAHAWTRFSCAGIPTINAFMSMHLSILQHPSRYIANDFRTLRNRSFPEELGRHGYLTHFFAAADPSWDGKVPWLRQWYQGITYNRLRETDDAMLTDLAAWLKDSARGDRPFMVGAITKTNHYPFNPEPGVRDAGPNATLQEKMRTTMEYTDASIGRFLASIRNEPWFPNTIFIIMADHGFPLSEHGSSTIGYGLYTESVWIPFVMVGRHPKLGPPALHEYPASQLDIGPTVLDLAGIRTANHYLGHSLARRATGLNSLTYLVRGEQGTLESGPFRLHGALGPTPREQGPEVFNVERDRGEKINLLPTEGKAVYDSLLPFLQTMGVLNTYTVEANILWPESAGPAKPAPEP